MREPESGNENRQSHEVGIAVLSAVGLLILIPMNYYFASRWFGFFLLFFFVWFAVGFPPTTKGDHHCIEIKGRYRISELIEDLSKTKYIIIGLVLLVRPILIVGEYYFPPAEISMNAGLLEMLVLGPLIEEFYFRGILQEQLRWVVSDMNANIITSGFFALFHWMPGEPFDIALLIRFVGSLFLGLVYEKTDNVMASFITHSAVNLW